MHGGGLTIKSLGLCSASLNLLCNYWFRSQPETSLVLIHKNRISLSPTLPSGNYTSRSSHDWLDFFSRFSWAKRQNHFYQNGSCLCCPVSGNNWVPALGAKLWRRKQTAQNSCPGMSLLWIASLLHSLSTYIFTSESSSSCFCILSSKQLPLSEVNGPILWF